MPKNLPKTAQGQRQLAILINEHFGNQIGVEMSRQTIQRWRSGRFIPAGLAKFPEPDGSNRYLLAKCFTWVESYIAARQKSPGKLLENLESKSEADARRSRAKANQEERADRRAAGELIERAVAERDAIGIVQRLHLTCVHQDETEIPSFCAEALKQLGVLPETVAAFSANLVAKMQSVTERRVQMFRDSTEEFLKEESKVQNG